MYSQCVTHSSRLLRMIAAPQCFGTVVQYKFMSTESHDDFKPQASSSAPSSVFEQIKKDVSDNDVMLYMKGHPEQPMCGFSARVVALLKAYDVQFSSRNVLDDNDLREGIKEFSSWPTIPQLYVNGEFVGGCDVLWQAHEAGEFQDLVKSTG